MANHVVNYDGSITATPQQLIYPETVEEIQLILRDSATFPSPVRAMGNYHSLTPCASSDGTIVCLSKMAQVVAIDSTNLTFTAQAGMQIIDASKALRAQNLQMMLNIEIGNMTLGSAACCHSKDALDGVEFGQVSSYVTQMKWVTPAGDIAEASVADNPDLLRIMRSSYGLCGIVYEVTLRIKPIETLHFTYLPRPVDELTQTEVDNLLDTSEGLICWTVGRTAIFQQRHRVAEPGILSSLLAAARRSLWNYEAAHVGQLIDRFIDDPRLRDAAQRGDFDAAKLLYADLHLAGGITLLAPDKTIDYHNTPVKRQICLHILGLSTFAMANYLARLPRLQPISTSKTRVSDAICHWALTTFVETRVRSYRIHRTMRFSRSIRFTRLPMSQPGRRSCENSTISHLSGTEFHC